MITINMATIYLIITYFCCCKLSYSEDKSTPFSGSETIINCLCRHNYSFRVAAVIALLDGFHP